MISCAQNFEDVILARALPEDHRGFYVDVGVWHPDNDSVTRHFYDQGGSGISMEALPAHFAEIQAARPRDINIQAAASSGAGPLRIHRVTDTGLSTSRPDDAQRHVVSIRAGRWM